MRFELRKAPTLRQLMFTLSPLRFDEDGQTLVEYALILIMVSVAAFALLAALGTFSSSAFSSINADF
jgi:Flp pilus assembly pilin Flp